MKLLVAGMIVSLAGCDALRDLEAERRLSDDFGRIPLGGQITSYPDDARVSAECDDPPGAAPDCAFVSDEGLLYYVYDGEIGGIEYSFEDEGLNDGGETRSFLGLKAGDTIEAIPALEARYGLKLEKSLVGPDAIFSSALSKSRTCEVSCSVNIVFDVNGVIKRISKQPEVPYI